VLFLKRFALPSAGLTLALAGVFSVAVSSGRAQTRPAPTADQAYMAAITAQVALATYQMDNAGLHDLDESLAKGTIPSGALGKVRRVRIVAAATQWPDPIQPMVNQFVEHAIKVEAALAAENAGAGAADAHELHDIGHSISNAAYAWLSGMAVSEDPGHMHP
jgi:hypothetical protein